MYRDFIEASQRGNLLTVHLNMYSSFTKDKIYWDVCGSLVITTQNHRYATAIKSHLFQDLSFLHKFSSLNYNLIFSFCTGSYHHILLLTFPSNYLAKLHNILQWTSNQLLETPSICQLQFQTLLQIAQLCIGNSHAGINTRHYPFLHFAYRAL